ncbi:MAG: hypothetical protein Aurels2KO_25650 [Aureliella sp.]
MMRRDMDVARRILNQALLQDGRFDPETIEADKAVIRYHLALMHDAGFIKGTSNERWALTWSGFDLQKELQDEHHYLQWSQRFENTLRRERQG